MRVSKPLPSMWTLLVLSIACNNIICSEQRLSEFNISVGNQSLPKEQKLCRYYPDMVPKAGSKNISCDTRVVGKYVSVRKTTSIGGDYLTICEIEIYGYRLCQAGRFSNDCVSCNCKDACSLETGKCPSTCLPGWFTDNCQRACENKKWGLNCANPCMCKDSEEGCNKTNGFCKSGCKNNYVGTGCEKELQTMAILTPRPLSSRSISIVCKPTGNPGNSLLPASSFVIQYRLQEDSTWTNRSVDKSDTGTGSILKHTVSGLLPNRIYLFGVIPQAVYKGVRYDVTPTKVSSETKTQCEAPATPLIQRSWVDCDDKGRTVRIIVSWEELDMKSHGCNSYSRIEVLYFPTESRQNAIVVSTKPQHKVVNLEVKNPRISDYSVIVSVFNDGNMSADSLTVSAGTSRNSMCKTVNSVCNCTGPIIGSFIAGTAVVLVVFLVIFPVKRKRSGRNDSDKRHSTNLSGKRCGPARQNSNSKAETGKETYDEINLSSTDTNKRCGMETGEHMYDKLDAEALSSSTYQNVTDEMPRTPMYESLSK